MEASDHESTPADDQVSEDAVAQTPAEQSVLEQVLEMQREQRAEIAAFRESLAQQKQARPAASSPVAQTAEELRQARLEELSSAKFYCPGCGRVAQYPRECEGRLEAPHPAIEMVSTEEVQNPPEDPRDLREWEAGHTAAPVTS